MPVCVRIMVVGHMGKNMATAANCAGDCQHCENHDTDVAAVEEWGA